MVALVQGTTLSRPQSRWIIGVCMVIVSLWTWMPWTSVAAEDKPNSRMHESAGYCHRVASMREHFSALLQSSDSSKNTDVRKQWIGNKRDGYQAAFRYLLEGQEEDLTLARNWLLKLGQQGGDLGKRALDANDEFFNQGQPWLGDVYYKIDTRPFFAYCWIYPGLKQADRSTIENGFLASARFRMRAMDRWSQTPNLMFKPTVMAAMAGLVTGNKELIDWGLYRKPWSAQGGYFSVLNLMLRDGGPWAEAPLYPLAHQGLFMMTEMSRLLNMTDGQDWFSRKSLLGGSPKGLVDYFIDSAYPVERTGFGEGQIRIASYGDGSTNADGDLFLVNPAGQGVQMHKELTAAYYLSNDPRYAAFLKWVPDYQADLIDRPPLPEHAELPAAPSRVWPTFGLALLRSDESAGYWTNEQAIAVFQIMSQGYGHDHRDKFSITLHGAGRLLYPDYNAEQYENPAIGWTRNTIAHNTVMVDEQDTHDAIPSAIRHDFNRDVKFLATAASEVFETVEQTRVLLLTGEYLLDIFQLASPIPHTYDYLLHSFGRPEPLASKDYKPSRALSGRYWQLHDPKAVKTDKAWALDFVIDEAQTHHREAVDQQAREQKKPGKKIPPTHYGPEWYDHTAAVRVSMAGVADTLVTYGEGLQALPMLVARRASETDTAFVAVHEPYSKTPPKVRGVTQLARSAQAIVVRVEADSFTDYVAAALGPDTAHAQHVLESTADPQTIFAFKNYGYLRVPHDGGAMVARGEWTGFRMRSASRALMVDGRKQTMQTEDGYRRYGTIPGERDAPFVRDVPFPMPVRVSPAVARLFERDSRTLTVTIDNSSEQVIAGAFEFDLPQGFFLQPTKPVFGPIQAGQSGQLTLTLSANQPKQGRHDIPYRIVYAQGEKATSIRSAPRLLQATIGPVLTPLYRYPEPPVYRVLAPHFTADLTMQSGLTVRLADDGDQPYLDGKPLFTFSDGEKDMLFEGTEHAFTWPVEAPASLTAHTYDRARWQAVFFGDRIMFRMDPDWTQFKRAYFTVPGEWAVSAGKPSWRQFVVADSSGQRVSRQAEPSDDEDTVAAELAFPRHDQSLCFQFVPPQKVKFTETGMRFDIGALTGDQWTAGFCQRGQLQQWLWRQ